MQKNETTAATSSMYVRCRWDRMGWEGDGYLGCSLKMMCANNRKTAGALRDWYLDVFKTPMKDYYFNRRGAN